MRSYTPQGNPSPNWGYTTALCGQIKTTADQTITAAGGFQAINFGAGTGQGAGGLWVVGSPSRWTLTRSGRWLFNWTLTVVGPVSTEILLEIFVGSSGLGYQVKSTLSKDSGEQLSLSFIHNLTSGNFVELKMDVSANVVLYGTASDVQSLANAVWLGV